jgi:asparagine synthase (glutamine-hydrolysing)
MSPDRLRVMGTRMADVLRRLPWLRAELSSTEHFCGGRVHAGVLNSGAQPLVTADARARVWFDGECRLDGQWTLTTPTADEAADLVREGRPAIADADGVFALAVLQHNGQLVLATDRLGFRPLYYTETSHWFAYAAEVKALLAVCDGMPAIDESAVRQYFAFDHMLGDRTWWRNIQLIPPASIWRISPAASTRQQYWSFDDIRHEPCSPADAHHQFGQLWERAVRAYRRPGRTPVLLSGGLDSRLLVAELRAQDADVVAVTYGSNQSPEVGPARAVARLAGIEHHVCEWNTRNWWQGREQAIWQTDGLVNANHLHPSIAMEEMRTGTCYSPMNVVGDLLFGGSHLEPTPWRELRNHPERLMARRFVPNPFVSCDEALEIARPDIERSAAGPSSDCVHLRQRVRRYMLHSPGCFAPYCETVFPGIGSEFLQLFLGSLSDEQRIGHRFYNRFLADRHPRFFANLPWQATGRGLWESPHIRIARDLKRRACRLLGIRRRRTPANQWFVDYPAAVRQHRVRERLLAQDLLIDEVLHGAARRALANDSEQPLAAESIIAILTVETYLRQVLGMARPLTDERVDADHEGRIHLAPLLGVDAA